MLWRLEMTTRGEISKMNRMVEIIRKNKSISKIQLVIASGISNSYYEKLKPYMEELFKDIVYDKQTKTWHQIEHEDIQSNETS